MKRIVIFYVIISFSMDLYSQFPYKPSSIFEPEEEVIGNTWYDLQTNNSCQNRIYYYEDGTIGAVWTLSLDPYIFSDRGTGYNYFNGSSWESWPEERIESQKTGWPSYAPLGENGEIVVSHLYWSDDDVGLLINKRETKGTGDWIESLFQGPLDYEAVYWPRMITGGQDHNYIYLIALTKPTSHGGNLYQGLDGALLYSRSVDGGNSWDILNQVLPGMEAAEYTGFIGDCYAFADPKDEIVAFVVGSYAHDLFLMKSTDFGETFEKTIIWDHPYDTIYPTIPTDTFYCVDGSIDVDLDNLGKAHVVFGIISTYYNNGLYINRLVDGVGYWNEDRETFSANINALNPSGGPGSEMIPDYNLIGWAQDLNGDSLVNYIMNSYSYYTLQGVSSMVQIVSDNQNRLFLVYSSITENYHNGSENYRRLWMRPSLNSGQTWGQFYHYDGDNPNSIFNEYVFPSCASYSDDNIYLIYQTDNEPGLNVQGQSAYMENFIHFAKIPKDEIVGIKQNNKTNTELDVSQNFPNPFSETTTIKVNLRKPSNIKLEVINMLGQKVYETRLINTKPGLNTLTIEAQGLKSGIYFYTVKVGEFFITKKMIIE